MATILGSMWSRSVTSPASRILDCVPEVSGEPYLNPRENLAQVTVRHDLCFVRRKQPALQGVVSVSSYHSCTIGIADMGGYAHSMAVIVAFIDLFGVGTERGRAADLDGKRAENLVFSVVSRDTAVSYCLCAYSSL